MGTNKNMSTELKTYTKQITEIKPRLEIYNSEDELSPREDSNLGYFITCERNRLSPDKHAQLERIVRETGNLAETQEEHIKLIKRQMRAESTYKVVAIYPITRYEHGNVVYKLGTASGFDYSNCGFYIITADSAKQDGAEKKDFKKRIVAELETYTKWVNGEIYGFALFDEDGEELDRCGGFYNLEDIREELPKEWAKEDLTKYIINN